MENTRIKITPTNFHVVTTESGDILTSEKGDICLQQKSDGRLYFIPATDNVLRTFNLTCTSTSSEVHLDVKPIEPVEPCTSASNVTADRPQRTKWSRDAITQLIEVRIKLDKEFKSTTTKKEVNWKRLSEEMKEKGFQFTPTQCNDKWRYLKGRYTSKKENMGSRGTGEPPDNFEFFDVMDDFLGKKPNINPVAIASSLKGDNMSETEKCENILDVNSDDDSPPPQPKKVKSDISSRIKRRKTPMEMIIEEIKNSRQTRETRHQEQIEVRNRAIDVYSSKMDLLIEKLNK